MWWCSLLVTDHHCGHLLIISTVFQLFVVSQASYWVCRLCCQWEYLLAFWHRLRIFIDDYRCWPLLAVCIYASGWCPSFHPSVSLSCQLIAGKWLQLLIISAGNREQQWLAFYIAIWGRRINIKLLYDAVFSHQEDTKESPSRCRWLISYLVNVIIWCFARCRATFSSLLHLCRRLRMTTFCLKFSSLQMCLIGISHSGLMCRYLWPQLRFSTIWTASYLTATYTD